MALDTMTAGTGFPPIETTHHGMEMSYVFDVGKNVFLDAAGNEVLNENLTAHKALELYRARIAAGIVG